MYTLDEKNAFVMGPTGPISLYQATDMHSEAEGWLVGVFFDSEHLVFVAKLVKWFEYITDPYQEDSEIVAEDSSYEGLLQKLRTHDELILGKKLTTLDDYTLHYSLAADGKTKLVSFYTREDIRHIITFGELKVGDEFDQGVRFFVEWLRGKDAVDRVFYNDSSSLWTIIK